MRKSPFISLVLASLVLAACSTNRQAPESPPPAPVTAPVPAEYAGRTNPMGEEAVTAGAQVFKNYCEACHGPQGHGDGPAGASLNPAPRNLAELGSTATDDYLFWRISTGKDGTAMAAWRGILTDEQIWQLISFIHTLK